MIEKKFLIMSIDTEPDNPLWKPMSAEQTSFKNISAIPRLLELANEYGIKPVFFLCYSMAMQKKLSEILYKLIEHGVVEIAAHFHPGETPPFLFNEPRFGDNALKMPPESIAEKFDSLHRAILSCYPRPVSFRGGAWTISPQLVELLISYGYKVDSTVTPGVCWKILDRPSYLKAPHTSYYLCNSNVEVHGNSGILEVPVSIYSNLPKWKLFGSRWASFFTMPLSSRNRMTIIKILRLIRGRCPIWLCPAFTNLDLMIRCAQKQHADYIHLMCHSNELVPGGSPYNKTAEDVEKLFTRLKNFFDYASHKNYLPITLSQYHSYFVNKKI